MAAMRKVLCKDYYLIEALLRYKEWYLNKKAGDYRLTFIFQREFIFWIFD